MERVLDELRLTDDQKEKVEEILRAHHQAMRKLMDEKRAELLKQMKGVLKEEQYKKFVQMMEDQGPPGGRPRGPGGRDGDRPGRQPEPPQ